MKIAYITAVEILGQSNTGSVRDIKGKLDLMKQAFGEKNVHVCAITANKEHLTESSDNMTVFYSNRSQKAYTVKNALGALNSRVYFGKSAERAVLDCVLRIGCEAVFFDSSLMGFLPGLLPHEIKQILFMQNIERDRLKKRLVKRPFLLALLLPFIRAETLAVNHADIILSLNSRDAALLSKYYGRSPDLILPVMLDDSFTVSDYSDRVDKHREASSALQLLFVGSFFLANENGITWLIDKVMPYVNAELSVIGKGFEKLAKKLNRSNVNVIGTVDDLSQYYHNAEAIVSPIFFGAGMKVKTAEAMMYGKPMFATDEALEGYDVDGLKNIYRCNSAKEFIDAINSYAENRPHITYDEVIRALFLDKYNTTKYIPMIKKLVTDMLCC